MRCPTLIELPPPLASKIGWPWMEDSPQMPDTMPDDSPWPRVSIVTPSYNQVQFIEETIRSVLLQGYPNLEYIVIDGGSTDGSIDIIRKYEPWLAYWSSEPDEGQSDALNKGFQHATGSIVAWINSDDWYLPGILEKRVTELVRNSDLLLVYGDCHWVDQASNYIETWQSMPCTSSVLLLDGNHIPQQSTFMRNSALISVGGINLNLHYIMDYELWLRLSLVGELLYVPGPVANFRRHNLSKSVSVGYKFVLEEIGWLSEWSDVDHILTANQKAEMFRRRHIVAALYAIFAGKEAEAIEHFCAALSEHVWPYGNLDVLAQRVTRFKGMGGQTMRDSWSRYVALARVLRQARPRLMAYRLWRRVASLYHARWVAQAYRADNVHGTEQHLLKRIWYDPRSLLKPGVLYVILELFLGKRMAGWLKQRSRRVMDQ